MSNKKKVTKLYSKRAYQKDLELCKKQYQEALLMLSHNLNLIKLGRDLLENNASSIPEHKYNTFVELLGTLVTNTEKTTLELEKLKVTVDNPPKHHPRTDIDVTEWILNVQNTILETMGWVPEVTPIYAHFLEEFGPEELKSTEEAEVVE